MVQTDWQSSFLGFGKMLDLHFMLTGTSLRLKAQSMPLRQAPVILHYFALNFIRAIQKKDLMKFLRVITLGGLSLNG